MPPGTEAGLADGGLLFGVSYDGDVFMPEA